MKKLIPLFFLGVFVLIVSFVFIRCSKQEDPIESSRKVFQNPALATKPSNSSNARTAGTECRINNISSTSTTAQPGTTVSFTYSNSVALPPNIVWAISNVVPSRSVTWGSGNAGSTISLTFGSSFVSCTLTATGTGSPSTSSFDCNTFLNISAICPNCPCPGCPPGSSTCSVSGTREINPCLGIQTYTYTNSLSPIQGVTWNLINVVPPGSATILSGSGVSIPLSFSSNFQSATLQAIGSVNGIQCTANMDLILAAPSCGARVVDIWCSQGTDGYNVMINASVAVGNPFCNNASVLIQWDPANFSGALVAGGEYSLGPNATATLPTQFNINANTSLAAGFYVPMIAKYTNLVTGQTCTAKLNPLVTGGCSRGPM